MWKSNFTFYKLGSWILYLEHTLESSGSLLDFPSEFSYIVDLDQGLRICTSEFPGDIEAATLGTHFRNSLS